MTHAERHAEETLPVNSPGWWDNYLAHHWDANDGAGQTRHFMQRLIAALPEQEAAYLRSASPSILDWGCAHGEGVDELARAFPAATVTGLDVAASAIDEARRRFPKHEFLCTPNGAIPRRFDVIVTSNCLEHFTDPLAVLAPLAAASDRLLVVLVPHDEDPLCEYHVARFGEATFPAQFQGLRRLAVTRVAVDPRYWAGEQLLVVYGTARHLLASGLEEGLASERAKWDAYYAGAGPAPEPPEIAEFNAEFAALVAELLPQGGRVIEAGAGDGWQSLALARTARYDVTLLDFSTQALRHARARFAQAGLTADFTLGDATATGTPDYDLVFNAGVLEHFGFDEQVRFVRGMASRSRGYVLSLVPNRRCPWYWLWRLQFARRGQWPYGKEFPAVELTSVFAAAGLRVLGERVVGASWAERFLVGLEGADPVLLRDLLTLHRSPILGVETKGYLLATLAAVPGAAVHAPAEWSMATVPSGRSEAMLTGALADALALQLAAQARLQNAEQQRRAQEAARVEELKKLEGERAQLRQEVDTLQARAAEVARRLEAEAAQGTGLAAAAQVQADARSAPHAQWQKAQDGEFDFWAGVAKHGYANHDPEGFVQVLQRDWMLGCLAFLDKPLTAWRDKTVVEFGSGPAGFVEYLEARRRIAIEPLIDRYRAVFPHLRTSQVEYLGCPAEEANGVPSGCADLLLCFNMLDHTRNPERIVAQMSRIAKPGADLLFQVNVYLTDAEVAEKTGHHAELHPHSFFPHTAKALLQRHGFKVHKEYCAPERSADGEHYFICAGVRE